jgi:hypothetical protein
MAQDTHTKYIMGKGGEEGLHMFADVFRCISGLYVNAARQLATVTLPPYWGQEQEPQDLEAEPPKLL